ncbi:uncharacterized protein LOC115328922 isoform X2 [Ixodes scapularis]|uniref:uncharacterized protein LOC115328922 isoform X2 n=1 Tax=Ixodes scapularis TaxID=6945 RepID=UPI001C387BB9|nr:uncharacterized protein LOC115328922 isoform X2 [Ixodes scapularis]
MSAGVDREPPEPPNTSRTSPRTPRTGGIHKGLNHARIVSKHGSLNRRLPPHARRKQEARSLNVKRRCEELALTFSRQPQNTTSPESLPRLTQRMLCCTLHCTWFEAHFRGPVHAPDASSRSTVWLSAR